MLSGASTGSGAADTLENVLIRIKRRMGCGFDLPLLSALGATPPHLVSHLRDLDLLFDTCFVRTSADTLRREANRLTSVTLKLRSQRDWLAGNGSSREQIRQVRWVVERFHILEPVLAVAAASARELLAGWSPSCDQGRDRCLSAFVSFPEDIEFASDEETAALLQPIARERPHPFLKGLAVWPDCAQEVRRELSDGRRRSLARASAELRSWVNCVVFQLRAGLPKWNSAGPPDLLKNLDECVRASCDVIALIAAIRRGLIADELAARRRRNRVERGRQDAVTRVLPRCKSQRGEDLPF